MTPLEMWRTSKRLHVDTFKRTRGAYLDPRWAPRWNAVVDAYDVTMDALLEVGENGLAHTVRTWSDAVSGALARMRGPRSSRCPTWRIDRDGVVRDRDGNIDGPGMLEILRLLRRARFDSLVHGWLVIWADGWRAEIERDDEAGLFLGDDEALPVAIATLVAITGCDVYNAGPVRRRTR